MRRHFGLDLVRGLALAFVVASHWVGGIWWLAGEPPPAWLIALGGVGVDLFFVLSGYLVGRGLLDVAAGSAPLRPFLLRRWARTLPLYAIVLLVLPVLSAPAGGLPEWLHYASFTQNLFGPLPPDDWLGVSWSLSAEEWAYVLLPAALLAARPLGRAAVPFALAVFLVAPVLARVELGGAGTWHAALLNIDAIGWGVALAATERAGAGFFRRPVLCGIGGLMVLGAAWAPYLAGLRTPADSWHPLTLTLAAIGCAGLLVAALALRTAPEWLAVPVRAVARHSYPVYLLHLPIALGLLHVVRDGVVGYAAASILFLAGTAALAAAAHRWVEAPGMRLPGLLSRPRAVLAAA
jgi:peptidoglycan/LPS O-acetylase OafA/YrhL